jgi:hypothetical protein
MGQQEGVQFKCSSGAAAAAAAPRPSLAACRSADRMAHRYHATRQADSASLLHGAPRRLACPVLVSGLADLGAGWSRRRLPLWPVGPCLAMGSSSFMLFCGQPAVTPHLPAPSLVHSSNRGGVLFRLGRELCVSVSQTPQRSWSSSFMEPGCRHHRRSLVTSVPCCMLDFEPGVEVQILKSPPTSRGVSKCLALISISSAGCLQLH